jgi:hypothetical protein
MRTITVLLIVSLLSILSACDPGTPSNGGGGLPKGEYIFTNPMSDTKVGEWCRYRNGEDEDSNTMLVEVVENRSVKGQRDIVMIEVEVRGGDVDRLIENTVTPFDRNHFINGYRSAGWTVMRMYPDEIVVDKRRFKCMCVEYLTRISGNVKVWYSHEIPVWGMLRQVRVAPNMQESINAELVDWSGRSEK